MLVGIKRERTPKKLKFFSDYHIATLGVFEKGKLIYKGLLFTVDESNGIVRYAQVSHDCEFDLYTNSNSEKTDYLKVTGVDDV